MNDETQAVKIIEISLPTWMFTRHGVVRAWSINYDVLIFMNDLTCRYHALTPPTEVERQAAQQIMDEELAHSVTKSVADALQNEEQASGTYSYDAYLLSLLTVVRDHKRSPEQPCD